MGCSPLGCSLLVAMTDCRHNLLAWFGGFAIRCLAAQSEREFAAMNHLLGQFGDARLDKAGTSIVEAMVLRQTVCLRQLGGDRGGELRAGRFFANPKVTTKKIIAGWSERSSVAVAGRHVLALQDTTAVTFATGGDSKSAKGGAKRRKLGQLNGTNAHGALAHVMLAVDADSRACLGLIGGTVWDRDGVVSTPEWKRPLAKRESQRWVETAEQAKPILATACMVTVVSDREGDMYPLWANVPAPGWHVLCRARRPSIAKMADNLTVAGTRIVELPARLEMRFSSVQIKRSPNEKDRGLAKTVRLTLIDVREVDPPGDVQAIHWQLLTTHAPADADQAWRIVGWYQARWTIDIDQAWRLSRIKGWVGSTGSEAFWLEHHHGFVFSSVQIRAADRQAIAGRRGRGIPARRRGARRARCR